jgi:hypothetical protein
MVIATAATTALISNATDEESFTNKALKVLFVVGASILLAGTAIVILLLLDVLDAVEGVFEAGTGFLDALNPFNDGGGGGLFSNPFISLVVAGPAYLLNTAFGRGTKIV